MAIQRARQAASKFMLGLNSGTAGEKGRAGGLAMRIGHAVGSTARRSAAQIRASIKNLERARQVAMARGRKTATQGTKAIRRVAGQGADMVRNNASAVAGEMRAVGSLVRYGNAAGRGNKLPTVTGPNTRIGAEAGRLGMAAGRGVGQVQARMSGVTRR
jgi:hypothetical protein